MIRVFINLLLLFSLPGFISTMDAQTRIGKIVLEPIVYASTPNIDPFVHAYFTVEILPGKAWQYLNARLTNPVTGISQWSVQNFPVFPTQDTQVISYVINVETFGSSYAFLQCGYHEGEWYTQDNFPTTQTILLTPQPASYNIPSGSGDPGLLIGDSPPKKSKAGQKPDKNQVLQVDRDKDMPNIDLDKSKDRTDTMACGPAAAANSLEWLKTQHKELQGDKTSLRSKVDSLKKYMNRSDKIGVRFDSMVVGKLTLIDALKLPIKVKYKTKHESGNTGKALKSTKPPHHEADNQGKLDEHPDFDWLKKEMDDGEDVEVHVGWYGPPDKKGNRERKGGHWLVVSGYKVAGKEKGITVKDDDDQNKKGGLRTKYFKWKDLPKTKLPYLDELKDSKGNIAIVESVVSESYDPTVTFDNAGPSEIPAPWKNIALTGTHMKPFYVAALPDATTSAFVPIFTGLVSTGVLAYVVLKKNDKPEDCSFTANAVGVAPQCSLSNGAIQIEVNPPGDYTFIWSNGSTEQNISAIGPGDYIVTISRSGTTCTQTVPTTLVNTNPFFDASVIIQHPDCGMQNGTAVVNPDPPGNYTFLWSNGSTEQSLAGLGQGNYSVTVSLGGTCERSFPVQLLDLPFDPEITFTATPVSCGLVDGSLQVSVNPPGAYDYAWSTAQSGETINNLSAGTYTVTVSIPGTLCSKSSEITLDELPPDFTINTTTTGANCGMSDGAAEATIDPPGDYSFAWSNGQTTSQMTSVPAGGYTLTVTKIGTTCAVSISVIIDVIPPAFTITATTTPSNCGASDGSGTLIVDPPGIYEYTWPNGQTTAEVTGLGAGAYQVTVTIPGTVCSKLIDITIEQLPPAFTLSSTTTLATCGSADGTATITVDPPGEYQYAWSNGETTSQILGLQTGVYIVTVTLPGSACSQSLEVTIGETPASFTVNVSTTPANCGLQDGSASATPDPPGAYDYQWSNGQTTSQATGLGAGSYTLTVTISGTSCSQITEVLVNEIPASFTVSVNATPSGCGQPTGTATAFVDPPAEYVYQWSNGQSGSQITGLSPGQYTVSVSLPGSTCIVTQDVTVDQTAATFTGTITSVPADCGLSNGSAIITVDPPDTYTYLWSNQQTGPVLQNVMPGTYSVIVTDVNSCTASFDTEITQLPVSYLIIINTFPGNCTGGGQISFSLSTNGAGPLVVEVISPAGTTSFTTAEGSYLLSAFLNVVPGSYTFNVYDESIGPVCLETESTSVQDQTPPLIATNDFYQTQGEQPVMENMLENDSGLNIAATAVSNPFGGMVTFSSNGEFTFTPNPGFSGDGSFVYTVTDACGNAATAVVIITVESVVCDFTITSTTVPAHCGIEDGSISVEVDEPGTYIYTWENGDNGPDLVDVPAGTYTVTIEDVNLGCELAFTITLTQFPANYISNVVVIQPTCSAPGEIQFTLSTPLPSDFPFMSVLHPNGSNTFTVEAGIIRLSDYVDIVPGSYTIEVFFGNAGPECIDAFEATLIMPVTPVIEVEAVFPPTEPTAMDGFAVITTPVPGTLPYAIFVDGVLTGTTNTNTFNVGGLGVGPHTIQIQDATGCFSNTVMVLIPFPNIILAFGTAISNGPFETSAPEHNPVSLPFGEGNSLFGTLTYHTGPARQSLCVLYTPYLMRRHSTLRAWFEAEHRSELVSLDKKWFKVSLEAGLGFRSAFSEDVEVSPGFYALSTSSAFRFGNILHLQTEISIRGWNEVEKPFWRINATIPFIK